MRKTDSEILPTKASPPNVHCFNISKINTAESDTNQKILVADKESEEKFINMTSKSAEPANKNLLVNDRLQSTSISKEFMPNSIISPTNFSTFNSYPEDFYNITLTDDDKKDKINTSTVTKQSITHKRSIFDIEDANSLSLADKLRNEANKYSDKSSGQNRNSVNQSEGDRTTYKKSCSTPTSPSITSNAVMATTTGNPSIVNSHTNERRPSWRLKLDTGCKV